MGEVERHLVYEHNPVREALVAFVFKGPPERIFDPALSGRLQGQASIMAAYPRPLTRQTQRLRVGAVEVELSGDHQPIRFASQDETRLLLLRPGMLSVHRLRPYGRWDEFRPEVETSLHAFLASSVDCEVVRVSVRTIHHWPVQDWNDLGAHLHGIGDPHGLSALEGVQPASLLRRQEFRWSEHGVVVVQQGGTVAEGGGCEATLDLEVAEHVEGIAVDAVMARVDHLQKQVCTIFEALITDRARAEFQ